MMNDIYNEQINKDAKTPKDFHEQMMRSRPLKQIALNKKNKNAYR